MSYKHSSIYETRALLKLVLFSIIFTISLSSCNKSSNNQNNSSGTKVKISTPNGEAGYIYVDGSYTGSMAPGSINIPGGNHTVGVALKDSWQYLLKPSVNITGNTTLNFTLSDKPTPKVWKFLFVGIDTVTQNGLKSYFTPDELKSCYDYFLLSVQDYIEKYSYGTMDCQITRHDLQNPVTLTSSSSGPVVAASDIVNLIPSIKPGTYDDVFVCWKQKTGSVDFGGNYFGLAETAPLSEPYKTGYLQVKFTPDPYATIQDHIKYYENNDPGVWVHEWLHTVAEHFFENKGRPMPKASLGGGFVVHAAESYGYSSPWMTWYRDLISGRVLSQDGASYLGIGPEAFLGCTVRETAVGCTN